MKRNLKVGAIVAAVVGVMGGTMAQAASWVDATAATALQTNATDTAGDLVALGVAIGGAALGIWALFQVFSLIRRAFASGKGR